MSDTHEMRGGLWLAKPPMDPAIAEIVDRVPLCGCGNPGESWGIVLEILDRAATFSDKYEKNEKGLPRIVREGDRSAPSFYDKAGDASARWVEFAAHVLGEHPALLLEHGTGIGWAWPTDDGWKLHAFLVAHGTDPNGWPERVET